MLKWIFFSLVGQLLFQKLCRRSTDTRKSSQHRECLDSLAILAANIKVGVMLFHDTHNTFSHFSIDSCEPLAITNERNPIDNGDLGTHGETKVIEPRKILILLERSLLCLLAYLLACLLSFGPSTWHKM